MRIGAGDEKQLAIRRRRTLRASARAPLFLYAHARKAPPQEEPFPAVQP